MKTVAEVIGVSRSNLIEASRATKETGLAGRRRQTTNSWQRSRRGYRRVHAILKRQALAAGLKPPNHKRVYRVMKVHGLLLDRRAGASSGDMTDASPSMRATAVSAPMALRSAATTVSGCGSPSRSIAAIVRP